MTPERWRQIEALYHSAREHGAGVLEKTDPELRREVERLLAQDSDGAILDRPVAELLDSETVTGLAPAARPGLTGQTVAHYQIQEEIGAGGMGVVYKALDTKLGRPVALKFLPPHLSHDRELRMRLSEEARAASALDHPNIVVIHAIDETAGGDVFIAMAFHEGGTLRERIAAGLEVRDALEIARQIASGLARAHEHGIVHRDIKPSNVVVAKDGVARIIDFGLARSIEVTVTVEGMRKGTPLYMSPEQAEGKAIDARTDLWSLGAVLYEMLSGTPPFHGQNQLQVMRAVTNDPAPRLRDARPDLPASIDAIVARALEKDRTKRYQSAGEMVEDLAGVLRTMDAPPQRAGVRATHVVAATAVILAAAGMSVWWYQRTEKQHWAKEQAIPQIGKLTGQNKPLAAYRMLLEAQNILPGDAQVGQIAAALTHEVAVRSTPAGAKVEIQDYLSPGDAWFPLGTTPLEHAKIPNGYLRWRVSKAGAGEFVSAPEYEELHGYIPRFDFALEANATAPQGMVAATATKFFAIVWSLGALGPVDLPAFYMDRFEVTNRQYQEFVDKGGYRRREYWKERFQRDGKELSWEQAIGLLTDSTGRPGPSTWAAGHYPEGQAEYPVGGVSWYESSAYAEFARKSLPALAQWLLAAPSPVARFIIPMSNFSDALAPVGKHQGVGPLGTYDMAGNVAEWCRNEAGSGTRYQMGGAYNTSTNEYFEPGGLPPFSRSANGGFRCVRNTAPLPAEATAERRQAIRDFANAKPVPDAVWKIYKAMYAYDRTPLKARVESVTQDSPDWRREKITLDAAYGKERLAVHLFVPAHVPPPYQAVVFFPSARALDAPSSDKLTDMKFFDYVIQSGRAIVYPIYKGTYERQAPLPEPNSVSGRDTLIEDSKDLGRALDYLETRPEFDRSRIGFMGESLGAALGLDLVAMEPRIRSAVFMDGGFYSETPLPGTDQADFAPRVMASTLMICGKFDWIFLGKDALLKMIGAPATEKKAVTLNTAHDVSEQRGDLIREVLAWFDRTLGKVQ